MAKHMKQNSGAHKRQKIMGQTELARHERGGLRKAIPATDPEGPARTSQVDPSELRPSHVPQAIVSPDSEAKAMCRIKAFNRRFKACAGPTPELMNSRIARRLPCDQGKRGNSDCANELRCRW